MSIPPPGYETPHASPPLPSSSAPQGAAQYELKSVQVLRGREHSTKAKWQNQGWEFVSEDRGTLRTELNFRRLKPKTFDTRLLSIVAAFRRMQPKQLVLVASSALVLVASIIGIAVGAQSGGGTTTPSALTTVSTAPSAEPTVTDTTVDEPLDETEPSKTSSETSGPDATESNEPDDEQFLTADNSEEFAALLAVPDACDQTIASFEAKYSGRTIEFHGSIANMANHGDYDTRYDILVAPGNKGPEYSVGPNFKFTDVNVFDLNLTGAGSPNPVGEGDRFRFVAQVVEYDPNSCLLFLAPVSTSVR